MSTIDMIKEAIAHYEAALKEAFPRGATGEVFHHWNEARYLIATEALDKKAENARELGLDYEPAQQEYERGFIDGMQEQMKRSVDRVVNAMAQRTWVGLTDEEIEKGRDQTFSINNPYCPCDSKTMRKAVRWAEAKLKEKNND